MAHLRSGMRCLRSGSICLRRSSCFSDSLCSIFRGYLHAAIGISSCLWPPGVLIDHDGSFDSLCPTPYYQLCTPETTSIATHLVRYSAVCTSTWPAHSSGSHLVFHLYKRGIAFTWLSSCVSTLQARYIIYTVPVCRVFGDHWSDLSSRYLMMLCGGMTRSTTISVNDPNGPIAGSTYCARPSTSLVSSDKKYVNL